MIDYNNIEKLEMEFEEVVKTFYSHHANMEKFNDYYNNNVFYAPKAGSVKVQNTVSVNLLKVFADKNIHYTSGMPDIKVTPNLADDFERNNASTREKIVLATMQNSNIPLKQQVWSQDATNKSSAVAITTWNSKARCPIIERYEPQYCYYQYANDNDQKLIAFWVAYPMTADQIKREFNVVPTHSFIDPASFTKQTLSRLDGKDWYIVVRRLDEKVDVAWVGNKFIQRPHNHQLGVVPVDVASPLLTGDLDKFPDFFLRNLISPQAEYNETMRKMGNIVRKMGNPAIWGRGIVSRQHEDVKRALKGDGGFVGLKGDGELGILQVPENKMLSEHLDRLFKNMQYLSGFGNATFGESVGANTSGDAINMYSQPTTRAIGHQNIAWKQFYESISAKILRYYDKFLGANEAKRLNGYQMTGTFLGTSPAKKQSGYSSGGFSTTFTKREIDGNYNVVVTPAAVTPVDEVAYKRLVFEAVSSGFLSKTTGYEEWGLQSPQDELELLKVEQADATLNPEGNLQNAQAGAAEASALQGVEDASQSQGNNRTAKGGGGQANKATQSSSRPKNSQAKN